MFFFPSSITALGCISFYSCVTSFACLLLYVLLLASPPACCTVGPPVGLWWWGWTDWFVPVCNCPFASIYQKASTCLWAVLLLKCSVNLCDTFYSRCANMFLFSASRHAISSKAQGKILCQWRRLLQCHIGRGLLRFPCQFPAEQRRRCVAFYVLLGLDNLDRYIWICCKLMYLY